MQDAFAYCAELVRAADRDRFLAALFAPVQHRQALHALYAFNIEVARVREAAREPMPGEIRGQWWRDVIGGERAGEAQANPVAAALLATIERHGLAASRLTALIEARRFDLYDEPMATLADLEAYASGTSSALFSLAGQILGADAEAAAEPAGIAYAITGLVRAFPLHAARHQVYVPAEILDRHHVRIEDILAGQSSADLNAALAALRDLAREQLRAARGHVMALPPAVLPAFLPAALVRPSLDRLDRCDAFAPVELSLWRRQWLIWRAAQNPARIAGR
jgi:15-cis-phytoene synthase